MSAESSIQAFAAKLKEIPIVLKEVSAQRPLKGPPSEKWLDWYRKAVLAKLSALFGGG